jgi:2-C-methyl-D-erythritol 4-phosphate cytidylyltransferase
MTVAAVIVAAGSGQRLAAGIPKAMVALGDRPIVEWAVRAFSVHPDVVSVVVVAPRESVAAISDSVAGRAAVVAGGATRQESVDLGLAALSADSELVLVHDAARPLVSQHVISAVVAALRAGADAVIPVLRVVDTITRVNGAAQVIGTVDRAELRIVQTPQGFRRDVLVAAHAGAKDRGVADISDDAGLVEGIGRTVQTVPGDERTFKITTPYDLALANRLVAQ